MIHRMYKEGIVLVSKYHGRILNSKEEQEWREQVAANFNYPLSSLTVVQDDPEGDKGASVVDEPEGEPESPADDPDTDISELLG